MFGVEHNKKLQDVIKQRCTFDRIKKALDEIDSLIRLTHHDGDDKTDYLGKVTSFKTDVIHATDLDGEDFCHITYTHARTHAYVRRLTYR